MSLTKRELWLMDAAFIEGRTSGRCIEKGRPDLASHCLKDWLNRPSIVHMTTIQQGLEQDAPKCELEARCSELEKSLRDLLFECDDVLCTKAPSVKMYNEALIIANKRR